MKYEGNTDQFGVSKNYKVNNEGWLQWFRLIDQLKTEPKYHMFTCMYSWKDGDRIYLNKTARYHLNKTLKSKKETEREKMAIEKEREF